MGWLLAYRSCDPCKGAGASVIEMPCGLPGLCGQHLPQELGLVDRVLERVVGQALDAGEARASRCLAVLSQDTPAIPM